MEVFCGAERGWLSEERRDEYFVCVRRRGRQTDRQSEHVDECGSESHGRCSHRNTVLSSDGSKQCSPLLQAGRTRIFW